jgi:hypothetical protein
MCNMEPAAPSPAAASGEPLNADSQEALIAAILSGAYVTTPSVRHLVRWLVAQREAQEPWQFTREEFEQAAELISPYKGKIQLRTAAMLRDAARHAPSHTSRHEGT